MKALNILKTNETSNDIIFLKDGVFEVSFNGKLNDLSDLINLYYREYLILAKRYYFVVLIMVIITIISFLLLILRQLRILLP